MERFEHLRVLAARTECSPYRSQPFGQHALTSAAAAKSPSPVAVTSGEVKNGSGKLHPRKRGHLVAAGAAVLGPDYRNTAARLEGILKK